MDLLGDIEKFSGFYKMSGRPLGKAGFYADLEGDTSLFELLRGEWKPTSTLQANWAMGAPKPGDIARGRSVTWYYLSQQVQDLLQAHDVTGWSTYPISLHNKAGELCPGYAGFCVTGRCGPIEPQRSKPVPPELRMPGTPDLIGLFFDESSWDGSDFFCPAGNNANIFVTERVKSLFDRHSITHFNFERLTEAMWYQ